MDILPQLILLLLLIILNALFSLAEIAVISANDTKTSALAEQGDKRAKILAKLKSKPARFIFTVQVITTLAGLFGSTFAATYFAPRITSAIISAGVKIPVSTLNTVFIILIIYCGKFRSDFILIHTQRFT